MNIMRPILGDRACAGELLAREITDELERLDIRPGQSFAIVRHEEIELSNPNEKHLGPFAKDSETSREAAILNYPQQGSQRWRIIRALRYGALTRDELQERTGLPENSIRPRVRELIVGGWVAETTIKRKTRNGAKAIAIVLTPNALQDPRTFGGEPSQ